MGNGQSGSMKNTEIVFLLNEDTKPPTVTIVAIEDYH